MFDPSGVTRAASPPPAPLLRGAFRPFFLLGPVWAVIALLIWTATWGGAQVLPEGVNALAWHQHEMLFGFVGAAVIGFLLTAIANWTGRPLLSGAPLAGMVALWVAARVVHATAAGEPWAGIVLEGALFAWVAGFGAREVIASRNRNLPIAAMVALLGIASVTDLAEMNGVIADGDYGLRAGFALVIMLMGLIGGRIIPAFTRNWLMRRAPGGPMPVMASRGDMVVLGLTAITLLSWIALPEARAVGWLCLLAAAAHLWRLSRWQGWRTIADPLVVVLHVAYLWLPLGLALLGLHLATGWVPRTAATHALGAGGMALLILAVMSRASLGHTGRPLVAGPALTLAYALVLAGGLLRVATALGWLAGNLPIDIAAALWGGGLALFAVLYLPVLTRPRIDDPRR